MRLSNFELYVHTVTFQSMSWSKWPKNTGWPWSFSKQMKIKNLQMPQTWQAVRRGSNLKRLLQALLWNWRLHATKRPWRSEREDGPAIGPPQESNQPNRLLGKRAARPPRHPKETRSRLRTLGNHAPVPWGLFSSSGLESHSIFLTTVPLASKEKPLPGEDPLLPSSIPDPRERPSWLSRRACAVGESRKDSGGGAGLGGLTVPFPSAPAHGSD